MVHEMGVSIIHGAPEGTETAAAKEEMMNSSMINLVWAIGPGTWENVFASPLLEKQSENLRNANHQ